MLSTLKNNITVSTAASTTLMTRMSKNAGLNFTSAIVEVILKDPKMDKLIKLEAFIQYLDQIKNKRVKDYIKEARTFLSQLLIEFEGTKEYYLPWVRFLDIAYIHKMNKPPGEQEEAFKEGIEEILKEFLAKYIKAKNIDWRIARKVLSLNGHFSLADSDMKDFEECILKALKVEIGIALEYLLWKEYLFVTSTTTALMSLYQCFVELEKGQDQGEKNLLEAILCGRFDKEIFKLEDSIIIGEDGGLYMLLNRLNQQEQDALISEQIVTSEYLKDKIKEKDAEKGDKIILGTGGFGTVRFALSLLRSRSLPGEIVCVKKTRSFQELGGDYKPTALEQVTESTLGDYFTNDRAQAIYSPCILDMALITTKKVIKDDAKDHRKGYLMMEILPQNTATRIFAEERYQKWEYQKPYLLDVLENTQKLLESSIAMTDLKPDNTLYDTDTRKATIIDLGGSIKVASSKDLFTFDIQKYSFQSTPQFRAPELGASKGVVNMYKSLAYSCGKVIEAVTQKTDADRQRISQLIKKLTTNEPLPRISLLDAITEIKGMGDDSYRKNIIFSHYINKVKDRLEHKKSAISINEDIDKTRELFINLNSTSLDPSKYKNQKTEDLLKKIENFLAPENTKQVMAIFGIAGSGKSIALQLKFMEAVYAWEPGQPLPIYFNLANGIALDQIIRTLNTELDTNLSLDGLDGQHLYIDSFDEGLGIDNKRDTLIKEYFRQVGSPKILITCRTDYLQDNSEDWFSPESKKLELCYVAPINYNGHQDLSNMIKKYVSYSKRHTSIQQDATLNTTEDYLKRLKQLQLTDLINTGFMFLLVMEVLFQLQDKKEGRVNQVDIYATYISYYQKSQIARLKPEQKKRLTEMIPISKENRQPDDLCSFAIELGKYLACQMHLLDQSRLGTVDLNKVFAALGYDSSLLFKHQSIIQILKLLPLKIVTTHSGKRFISNQEVKIGFIHETIKNYYLLEAIKSEVEREDKSQILASQSIIHDIELVKLIALGIIGNPKLTTAFLKAIENSKRDKSASSVINASNSITLLVAARHSFSGYDLSNIAVKGANIVNGIFHYAKLDDADLSRVEMSNVNLIGASLNGADMRGVNFSIFPDLVGHTGEVTSVSLSLDGKFLASGSWDNRIKIWNPSTGECLKTLSGHGHHINSVSFSPDGKLLASGSRDKTVKIWNTSTSVCLNTLGGHSGFVYSVCFSSDGKRLASGSEDTRLKIWDAKSGECIHTLFGHAQPINSVTYSHDGKFLATGSDDETIKIWDADTGVCRNTIELGSTVCGVSFSHDSKLLASGLGFPHPTIKIWNPISGECLQTLTGHTDQVKSVSFSPDGKFLVSGSQGKSIKIWNISTSECLQTLNGHANEVRSVSFSPDGKFIASGSDDKTIKIWSPSAGECLQGLDGHIQRVSSVSYSHDSKFLASGSEDKTIKIWNPSTGECLQTLDTKSVNSVSFSPDAKSLASGSWDTSVKIWNLNTGECLQELYGHSGSIYSVSYSPDGQSLASGSGDKTIKIWNPSSGKCLQTLQGHAREVFSVVFSSDGQLLASGSWDDKIKIWNPSTGECVRTLMGHKSYVYSISFSPDNKFLASGSYDQTIKIWDLSTGESLHTLNGHASRVYSVSFSPDGKLLASGSQDHTIKIWDPSTGKCLQDLIAHTSEVNSVSFSPDGKSLASGSTDKTIDIFKFEAKSNAWLLKTNITDTLAPLLAVGASFKDTTISQNNNLILTQKKADTTSSVISNAVSQTQHHIDTSPESQNTAKQLSQAFLEKLVTHQQSQNSKFFIFSVYTEEEPVIIPRSDQRQETQDFTPALSEHSPDHSVLPPQNPPDHSFKDNHRTTACCQIFAVPKIIYDNPLLNSPALFAQLSQTLGHLQALKLGNM